MGSRLQPLRKMLSDKASGRRHRRNFDFDTCECTQYQNRCTLVPECLKLTKNNVGKIGWMPKSCAYRCLIEGRPRPVREPVSAFCISENLVSDDELEDHILERDDL